jgi:hypothetical protein
LEKMTVYYHIAAMGHWKEVVIEQLRQLRRVFSGPLKIGIICVEWETAFVEQSLMALDFAYELRWHGADYALYEYPTLEWLEADCRAGLNGQVAYMHTKGVSGPTTWETMQWRWLMTQNLCQMIAAGSTATLSGAFWVDAVPTPYMAGNFWAADAGYVATLQPLCDYRRAMPQAGAPAWAASDRHRAELWVGSGHPTRVNHLYHNVDMEVYERAFWEPLAPLLMREAIR